MPRETKVRTLRLGSLTSVVKKEFIEKFLGRSRALVSPTMCSWVMVPS